MVIRRALGETLPNQGHYFNAGSLYKRFTPAGPDHAQVAACAGMADYVDRLYAHHYGGAATTTATAAEKGQAVHDLMRAHEVKLLQPLLDYLEKKNSARLLGPARAEARAPTVAVAVKGDPGAAAAALAKQGIMAGGGDFYAVRALAAMGISPDEGVLRLSFVHYTTESEVKALINALDSVI